MAPWRLVELKFVLALQVCVAMLLDVASYGFACSKQKSVCSLPHSFLLWQVFHCVHFECPSSRSTDSLAFACEDSEQDVALAVDAGPLALLPDSWVSICLAVHWLALISALKQSPNITSPLWITHWDFRIMIDLYYSSTQSKSRFTSWRTSHCTPNNIFDWRPEYRYSWWRLTAS